MGHSMISTELAHNLNPRCTLKSSPIGEKLPNLAILSSNTQKYFLQTGLINTCFEGTDLNVEF